MPPSLPAFYQIVAILSDCPIPLSAVTNLAFSTIEVAAIWVGLVVGLRLGVAYLNSLSMANHFFYQGTGYDKFQE